MRSLTFTLVALALLMNSGGVVLRNTADAERPIAQSASGEPPAQSAAAEDPAYCPVPEPVPSRTIRVVPRPQDTRAIGLNAQGYNYATEGDSTAAPAASKR